MLVIASPSLLVLSSALKFISELSSILTIRTAFSESSDEKSYRFMQIPVFTHESPAGVYPGSSLPQDVSDRTAARISNKKIKVLFGNFIISEIYVHMRIQFVVFIPIPFY